METVTIHDKKFTLQIPSRKIQRQVKKLAAQLNDDLAREDVVFIAILNGSFMFASDLLKKINFNARVSFMKLASYAGTQSTGEVTELIGNNEVLEGKTVVIIEDIVESGNTLNSIVNQLYRYGAARVKVVSLLFKPDSYEHPHKIDYTGFKIANDFVVGYGLDYDGLGRNLESIYKVMED